MRLNTLLKISTYKTITVFLFTVCFLISSNQVTAQRPKVPIDNTFLLYGWKYTVGDDIKFADPNYNDKGMPLQFLEQFSSNEIGIHWFRTDVNYKVNNDCDDLLSVGMINVAMACDVYWDGVYIGSNGKVGTDIASEIPGQTIKIFKIPRELSKSGDHIIAVRLSNFHGNSFSTWKRISFGYYSAHVLEIEETKNQHYTYMGIYLTALLFSLALFFGTGNERSYLIISVYFLLSSIAAYIDYIMIAQNYSLPVYSWLFVFQLLAAYSVHIFMNIFLLFLFSLNKKSLHIGLMILLLALCEISGVRFNYGDLISKTVMLLYSLVILSKGLKIYKKEAVIIIIGVTLNLLVNAYTILAVAFYNNLVMPPKMMIGLTHIIMLLSVIIALSERIRSRNKLYEAIRLKSQRLENELLKKSIQPHFMVNTLLSLKSWLTRDKTKAEKLIESLSEEFQIINKISHEKEIPIGEEIILCQHHLALMGLRRDATYKLNLININENENIPPMVLHTLIENGLTHAYQPKENGTFDLQCKRTNSTFEITLINDGSRLEKLGNKSDSEIEEGLGLRYVKARLEESYSKRWNLEYGLDKGKWFVKISINKPELA